MRSDRTIVLTVAALSLLWAAFAQAQDFTVTPSAGTYTVRMVPAAQSETCGVDRTDVGPAIELASGPCIPGEVASFDVTLPVEPGVVVTVRGWASNAAGRSVYSAEEAALLMPPAPPTLQP